MANNEAQDFLREKLPNGDFGDILIKDGDFVTGPSDTQHLSDIVLSAPGWFKEFPLLGVDPINSLNARQIAELKQQINIALQSDGYNTQDVNFTVENGKFVLKQNATRG